MITELYFLGSLFSEDTFFYYFPGIPTNRAVRLDNATLSFVDRVFIEQYIHNDLTDVALAHYFLRITWMSPGSGTLIGKAHRKKILPDLLLLPIVVAIVASKSCYCAEKLGVVAFWNPICLSYCCSYNDCVCRSNPPSLM